MKTLYSHGLKNMLGLLSAEKLKGLTDLPYGAAYGRKKKKKYAGCLKETDAMST